MHTGPGDGGVRRVGFAVGNRANVGSRTTAVVFVSRPVSLTKDEGGRFTVHVVGAKM